MSDYRRGAPDPPPPNPETGIRIVRDDGVSIPLEDFIDQPHSRSELPGTLLAWGICGFSLGVCLTALFNFFVSRF